MTWKDEIKKYYIGYGEDMAEMSANSERMQEELTDITKDLIEDLQKAVTDGKVSDGKLKSIFKKYGIKFDVMDYLGV